jgi:CheY-like chemotaxis protein
MGNDKSSFTQQVRDALAHLYDYAYMQTHPLANLLVGDEPGSEQTRGQELRRILLEAIEALNPGPNVPFRSPERRGYVSLFCRYVEGQSPAEIAQSLAISERQLRRDHGQALEAVTSILWNQHTQAQDEPAEDPERNAIRREASRAMSWADIELSDTVGGVLSGIAGLAEQRGVSLSLSIPDDLPPLHASRTLVRQILFNVLGRTLQHMSGGEVTLEARLTREKITISVAAMGSSEAGAHQPHPLQEELSTSFQFVESLGGRMWLEEAPDRGWAVRFTLPAATQATVLAIDDNEALFRLFERYLAQHHYRLVGVQHGDEGVKLARELQPAVITLDVMMPDRDGWEILQTLCTDPLTSDIPVIVCTVLDELELALSLGARAYLKKPIERSDLLAALEHVLNTA